MTSKPRQALSQQARDLQLEVSKALGDDLGGLSRAPHIAVVNHLDRILLEALGHAPGPATAKRRKGTIRLGCLIHFVLTMPHEL